MTRLRVPFAAAAPREDAAAVRAAIDRVIASGWFVLGPEVEGFEREFAAGRWKDGVLIGIEAATQLLIREFPREGADLNEQENRPAVL